MIACLESAPSQWKLLAKGSPDDLAAMVLSENHSPYGFWVITIAGGTGIYGVSIGAWQGPLMAAYVGIKLPLIVFITLGVNGILNGLLAQLLGSGLGFRQTLRSLLASFSLFSLIVGSLAPVCLGMALDMPAPSSLQAAQTHRSLLVFHTMLIAFAGLVATRQLLGLLQEVAPGKPATRTLFAWITGNLFAGAQIGFLLRPIFGHPGLKIEFLRPDLFSGNFYESVWWALKNFL